MDLNLAVARGIGDASQDESLSDLIVFEEGLLGLVDCAILNLTSAGRASTSAARVREFDTCLLSGVCYDFCEEQMGV